MYKKQSRFTLQGWLVPWVAALGLWPFATLAGAAPQSAANSEVAQVDSVPEPPPSLAAEFPALSLTGAGDFDVLFWNVYTAALWAPAGDYSPGQPHALAIRYERAFDGKAIAERSIEEIEGLGIGSEGERERWLELMLALFPDVSEGDQLTGVHYPGQRAVFYRNDERIGSIDDPAFAKAFFSIWLDEETSAPELRERLLGMSGVKGQSAGGAP